jgi:hypothetical protein
MMDGKDDEGDAADMDDDGDEEGDEDDAEEEALDVTSELGQDSGPAYEGTETEKSPSEMMREYANKVAEPKGGADDNTKSPVAGKNDMGGTASNLVAGGEADTKGTAGGLAGNTPKVDDMGNVNKVGGGKHKPSAMPKGHGAEKKGAGETGTNSKSTIGS